MNAQDLTFGVEIETIAPDSAVRNHGLRIGHYRHGIQVPYLPTGWTAEADGSIDNGNGGHRCEIVSPVLREKRPQAGRRNPSHARAEGAPGKRELRVHVHVGWKRNWPSEALARLVTIVAYVEKGLYAITGTKARERGRYCGGVRKYGNDKTAKPNLDRDRYHALNLTNLAARTKDTVEFRVFSGTTNATKVIGWIQVCLGWSSGPWPASGCPPGRPSRFRAAGRRPARGRARPNA